jgi:hypothetical protein
MRKSLQRQEKYKGVKGYAPLGLPPPLGERGGHPHNNRGLPNNSKIKDFYRAKIFTVTGFLQSRINIFIDFHGSFSSF